MSLTLLVINNKNYIVFSQLRSYILFFCPVSVQRYPLLFQIVTFLRSCIQNAIPTLASYTNSCNGSGSSLSTLEVKTMSVSRLKPAYRVVWTMCNLLFSECVTVSPLSHRPFWYFHLTSHNVCLEGSVVCRLSSNPSKYVSVFSSGGDQVFMFP